MTDEFEIAQRNRVRLHADRGNYDREVIYQIIDEAICCHVAFVEGGQPFVIPINHARSADRLLLHGSPSGRLMERAQAGEPLCIAITLIDGLVLARSAFSHSVNYRSVVLFGRGYPLTSDDEKLQALEAITEHLVPGRWAAIRRPTASELKATAVVAMPIESASAKIRSGPPVDGKQDRELPIWAGVLPLQEQPMPPVADPLLDPGIPVPDHVRHYRRK
jgi:hypothetical protein